MALLKYENQTQRQIFAQAKLMCNNKSNQYAVMPSGRHWRTRMDSVLEMIENDSWEYYSVAVPYLQEFISRYSLKFKESEYSFSPTLNISERDLWNKVDNLFALFFVSSPFRTANPPRFNYENVEEFISTLEQN